MEITQPSSHQLILRLRPIFPWLFAGIFGVVGMVIFFRSSYLLGSIFVLIGVGTMLSIGQIVTCVFDKASGRLTLTRQGLLGTQRTERRIQQISMIQVEASISDDSRTYRVSILLTTGERLPLTSYYSGGREDKQEAADRIRAFLNLNDPTTDQRHSMPPVHGNRQPATSEQRATSKQHEMTPERWELLATIAQKSVIILTDDPVSLPTGTVDLRRLGYVETRSWGAGDRGVEYLISAKGRQALADYRASQS